MGRLIAGVLLGLAFAWMPALAQDDALEAQVREIEKLAVTAHWRKSEAAIARLSELPGTPTAEQRHRIEFVRLRNLALAGDQASALEGLAELLEEELPVGLRLRVYNTAISVAANL